MNFTLLLPKDTGMNTLKFVYLAVPNRLMTS